MTDCVRKGNFKKEEKHQCFVLGCNAFCYPKSSKTCPQCNFKYCEKGHCACTLSKESQYALKVLYETFCTFCQ